MHVIRDRAEARWLPSRRRYALARLFAFVMLRNVRPEPRPGLILSIDRDQDSLENHFTSWWIGITTVAYFAAPMPGWWKLLAIPIAMLAIQLPMYFLGAFLLPLFGRSFYAYNHRINATCLWSLLTIASSYFATTDGVTRFIAYFFFVMMALNAVAAAILFLLRGSVAALEARCGA